MTASVDASRSAQPFPAPPANRPDKGPEVQRTDLPQPAREPAPSVTANPTAQTQTVGTVGLAGSVSQPLLQPLPPYHNPTRNPQVLAASIPQPTPLPGHTALDLATSEATAPVPPAAVAPVAMPGEGVATAPPQSISSIPSHAGEASIQLQGVSQQLVDMPPRVEVARSVAPHSPRAAADAEPLQPAAVIAGTPDARAGPTAAAGSTAAQPLQRGADQADPEVSSDTRTEASEASATPEPLRPFQPVLPARKVVLVVTPTVVTQSTLTAANVEPAQPPQAPPPPIVEASRTDSGTMPAGDLPSPKPDGSPSQSLPDHVPRVSAEAQHAAVISVEAAAASAVARQTAALEGASMSVVPEGSPTAAAMSPVSNGNISTASVRGPMPMPTAVCLVCKHVASCHLSGDDCGCVLLLLSD